MAAPPGWASHVIATSTNSSPPGRCCLATATSSNAAASGTVPRWGANAGQASRKARSRAARQPRGSSSEQGHGLLDIRPEVSTLGGERPLGVPLLEHLPAHDG